MIIILVGDPDYQRRFATALVCSLIATIAVFGGAIFAFEYWKRKHYGEDYGSTVGGAGVRIHLMGSF